MKVCALKLCRSWDELFDANSRWNPLLMNNRSQGRKDHDSHRRDRIWRDCLHRIFRHFLQILGARLSKLHINTGEKAKKSSGEPPVETAPRNCRFLSLVVVELVRNPLLMNNRTELLTKFWEAFGMSFCYWKTSIDPQLPPSMEAILHK